jgi:hypothetical protein
MKENKEMNGWEGMGREGKGREGKGRKGKGRKGKKSKEGTGGKDEEGRRFYLVLNSFFLY